MNIFEKAWGGISAFLVKNIMKLLYRPKAVFYDKKAIDSCAGPIIFVSNHTSCRDPILLLTLLKDYSPYTLAAKDWYEKKYLHSLMKRNRCIPVDRYKLDTSWLRSAINALGKNGSILIFPEGHTIKYGETDEFKSGFLMLAIMSKAKIVPIWHDGYKMFHRTKAVIGTPFEPAKGIKMTVADLVPECDRVRNAVIALSEPESKKISGCAQYVTEEER